MGFVTILIKLNFERLTESPSHFLIRTWDRHWYAYDSTGLSYCGTLVINSATHPSTKRLRTRQLFRLAWNHKPSYFNRNKK
ncbi:hypothetical protein BpHYR1_017639 [Brachionus plicatilis]|uniref:Uncharacterized protein n=1 Tax=Brachionus plicatilis TaxID=10195 RepID=A0A3M7SDY7_BRAPC|nr:hypothetical protein BpHYR1_017639 [Brachionus plicatilis]